MTTRLFALLVLLTIVPAAFVLWFMNAAVSAENESARQRVREAYRGQLRLVRSRLDPLWRGHAARLAVDGAPERFWAGLRDNHARFPRGVDVILAAPDRVAALPRTTSVAD